MPRKEKKKDFLQKLGPVPRTPSASHPPTRHDGRSLLRKLGPGFITGASDDDPSGIATYSQTGAIFGYAQLWAVLWTLPFMIAIQEMCGRIGLVTGKGIAGVMRTHYGKPLLYVAVGLLLIANTINIGADLGAMAASAALVIDVPFPVLLLLMTAVTLVMEIFISYRTYASYLKYLTLSLFAYVLVAFVVDQDWQAILTHTLVPHVAFTREYLMNIVAFLGTTISPYLFFWQASEEVEEEIAEKKLRAMGLGKPIVTNRDMKRMEADTALGMFFSNFITFFIIATTASTLHGTGITDITSAAQAAEALRPVAGDFAFVLFALGIVGTGLLAVPILAASASYAVSEAFKWREGLSLTFRKAHGFYGVITIATLVGLCVNFISISPFTMLYYTAVINGIIAPPLLVFILLIANNKKIMGKRTNGKLGNTLGIAITAIMGICAVALIGSMA